MQITFRSGLFIWRTLSNERNQMSFLIQLASASLVVTDILSPVTKTEESLADAIFSTVKPIIWEKLTEKWSYISTEESNADAISFYSESLIMENLSEKSEESCAIFINSEVSFWESLSEKWSYCISFWTWNFFERGT